MSMDQTAEQVIRISDDMGGAPKIVAEVHSMTDIREALRARFETLEISRATIDEAAGLTDGHSSKLLAGLKGFGDISLFPMLETAGLRLALVEDPKALERASKLKKRASLLVRCRPLGKALMKAARPAVLRELGAKGGRAAMAKLSPDQRHKLARAAAQARWSRKGSR